MNSEVNWEKNEAHKGAEDLIDFIPQVLFFLLFFFFFFFLIEIETDFTTLSAKRNMDRKITEEGKITRIKYYGVSSNIIFLIVVSNNLIHSVSLVHSGSYLCNTRVINNLELNYLNILNILVV